jgi:hypothetical protein
MIHRTNALYRVCHYLIKEESKPYASSPHNQSKKDAVRTRPSPSLFCNKVIGAERAMSPLDASPKGAGLAHLSAPAVSSLAFLIVEESKKAKSLVNHYIGLRQTHGQVIKGRSGHTTCETE